MTSATEETCLVEVLPVDRVLKKNETKIYPNLHTFLDVTGTQLQAELSTITFTEGKSPVHISKPQTLESHRPRGLEPTSHEPQTAKVYTIKDIDAKMIRELLDNHVAPVDRPSFLKCLDDHLADHPAFNFDDAQLHVAPAPSTLAVQQHVAFSYTRVREFKKLFDLTYDVVQDLSRKQAGVWRDGLNYGPMEPIQRIGPDGSKTQFAPLAVIRTHITAWFDAGANKPWRLGIILVDSAPTFSQTGKKLRPPYFKIAGHTYEGDEFESMRELLSRCMGKNPNLNQPGIPAPLVVVQDMYRLMYYEWSRMQSYFTRDLNNIALMLHGGRGVTSGAHNADAHKPSTFRTTLRSLFFLRRRLERYRHLIREQLATCRDGGRQSWWPSTQAGTRAKKEQELAKKVAKELVVDFLELGQLMAFSFGRVKDSIQLIMGETALREADRSNQRNRILLVLAIVSTILLPVSVAATVFNMTGEWAPQQPGFPFFWAVCITITVVLIFMLVVITYWKLIWRRIRVLRWIGRDRNEDVV